ncbi:hypothetical protein GCM10012284_62880 [Mangrovihabitans endophyticus]|uniref:Uncharacterized protein n=1 Tax=Mangrovihabitans endophyticus TaxID=1751298 RepID=A0A8J3C8G1_9ACTN|nr:hypothetical protein GCM10012284_62880 [Mangrovihabitans endophyticus]
MADRPIEVGTEPFSIDGEHADDRDESTPRSTRTRAIVVSCLLAAAVAGAATLGVTVWRVTGEKNTTLSAPDSVAGLRKNDTQQGRDTADYLRTALAAEVDLDSVVAAVYTDPAQADSSVLFFGGTALIWTPESDLDTAFSLVSDEQGAVNNVHTVAAGPLHGTMKCGVTASDGSTMPVCGWADHGSLALAMFPNRSVDDAAELLREIRSAAQTR